MKRLPIRLLRVAAGLGGATLLLCAQAQAPAPAAGAASAVPAASAAASAPAATPAERPVAADAPLVAPNAGAERPFPAGERTDRVTIADPYIELRTGPGRGYPIFHVAQRGEAIDIELRHTDWFRVRTASGRVGWVTRQQLESTLTAAGEKKSFRDVLLDDYLARRVQLGGAWGHFKKEPMLKVWGSWRLSESLHVEGTLGQVQGVFSGTDFWSLGLVSEPWSDRRFSPFAGIGVGRFRNFPNLSLVDAQPVSANTAHAMVGIRWYLSERFVARADYTLHTVFVNDSKTQEYRSWTAGLAFFF